MNMTLMLFVTLLALASSWATNRAGDSWNDLNDNEPVAVLSGVLVLLSMTLIPPVRDFLLGSQGVGTLPILFPTAAYTSLPGKFSRRAAGHIVGLGVNTEAHSLSGQLVAVSPVVGCCTVGPVSVIDMTSG